MTTADERYFEAIAERDYLRFCLEQMHKNVKKRSVLDTAIDQASGHEAAMLKEAKKAMARIKKLSKIIDELEANS
jgi:hypothetical protein